MNQQHNKATNTDKLEIENMLLNMFCLDNIERYTVKHYYKHEIIFKIAGLVHTENIKK